MRRTSTLPNAVLHIEHGWGGGIERHLQELAAFLDREGIASFRATPLRGQSSVRIASIINPPTSKEYFLHLGDTITSASLFGDLNIDHVHIHSLIAYDDDWFSEIFDIIDLADVEYDFTIHDYAPICPRVHMLDIGLTYCNTSSMSYCNTCLTIGGSRFGETNIARWRERYMRVLNGARRIFVPNEDVAWRMHKYLNASLTLTVREHPEATKGPSTSRSARRFPNGKNRRVAILGRLASHKGAHVVTALATDAFFRRLPIEFILYGDTSTKELYELPNVTINGEYSDDTIDEIIDYYRPDMAFYASVCPETFNYALSISFRNSIFPVCFDIGAQARRIRQVKFGLVVPLSLAFNPTELNDLLLNTEIGQSRVNSQDEQEAIPPVGWPGARAYYSM